MPGCGGTITSGMPSIVGDLRAMQRAGAAEGDQRVVARIDALLDGARADGVGHVGVDHGEHALGRLAVGRGRARAASSPITRRGGDLVERHAAAQEVLAVEPAQHDIGVGHRRRVAAAAVGGGAGHGAGQRGPTLKAPAWSTIGDRAAAGADRVDVDHRHQHGKARDPGVARASPRRSRRRSRCRYRPRCRRRRR